MAQSVEHVLGKDEVTGSNPVISSKQGLPKFFGKPILSLGVAQFGSALEWGSRGRKFESSHSDHKKRRWCTHRLLFLTVLSLCQNGTNFRPTAGCIGFTLANEFAVKPSATGTESSHKWIFLFVNC